MKCISLPIFNVDGKKLATNSLMMLIESLQQQYGIVPGRPKCLNKTGYISVFVSFIATL